MRDFDQQYVSDRPRKGSMLGTLLAMAFPLPSRGEPLPELPPVSHMELGRQEPFSFPDRRRDPFPPGPALTNSCVAAEPEPVTLEGIKALMDELPPEPVVVVHKPSGVGMTERQFLDALFGCTGPLPCPVPIEEPEKVGTALPMGWWRR